MSIYYEVNIFVKRQIELDYRAWLVEHIREILALPGFLDANSFDVQQEPMTDEIAICVQYRLASQTALDDYFRLYAPALRAKGTDKFGDGSRASRRVMTNARQFSRAD